MHPPQDLKGQGVADGNAGGCISIFEQALAVNYFTVTTFTADTTVNIVLIVITATMVSSDTVGSYHKVTIIRLLS